MDPEKKVINEQSLNEQFFGMESVLKEMSSLFISQKDQYLNDLKKALAGSQAKSLEIAAHTLKGAASNFFAERVTDLAFQLEQSAKEGKVDRAPETIEALGVELEKLCQVLEKFR